MNRELIERMLVICKGVRLCNGEVMEPDESEQLDKDINELEQLLK